MNDEGRLTSGGRGIWGALYSVDNVHQFNRGCGRQLESAIYVSALCDARQGVRQESDQSSARGEVLRPRPHSGSSGHRAEAQRHQEWTQPSSDTLT